MDDISTYDTLYETPGAVDEKAEFDAGSVDYAVFTSASTVRGFEQAVKGIDFSKVKAVCIGRQTKAAADALGMETYMAEQATMDSVVACVEKLLSLIHIFSNGAVEKALDAIRNGAWIVTDTQMAKAGINKRALARYGGEVCCFMSDEDVAAKAKAEGTTLSLIHI